MGADPPTGPSRPCHHPCQASAAPAGWTRGKDVAVSHSSVFVTTFLAAAVEVIEMVIIVVGVAACAGGGTHGWAPAAAFVVVAGAGLLARGVVQRIPRSALQLVVGTLLSSFGTFWAVQGLGVAWTGGDAAILGLVGWYALAAAGYVGLLRRRARRLLPQEASR